MPRSWAVAGSAAVGLVLAGSLVACAPEPVPPVPTTDRPSPTAEPAPTPTPEPAPETVHPERPAAMDTVDAVGAEAAVEYFLSLYGYAYATGDLDEWRALSHPECIFCASVIDNVEENNAAGTTAPGAKLVIEGSAVEELAPQRFRVTAVIDQGSGDRQPADVTVMVSGDGDAWTVWAVDVAEATS